MVMFTLHSIYEIFVGDGYQQKRFTLLSTMVIFGIMWANLACARDLAPSAFFYHWLFSANARPRW
jgi:hypothetical protein